MNGWVVAIVVGVCAALWVEMHKADIVDANKRADQAEAMLDAYKAQRENTERFDGIDKDLKDGGKDVLSDYMRGAAGKLWP